MDLITNNTMQITELALDGLSARTSAISSNIANAETPNYRRVDVEFEDQLKEIMQNNDDLKQAKIQNSIEVMRDFSNEENLNPKNFNNVSEYVKMAQKSYESYSPSTIQTPYVGSESNNISIEQEMSELNKAGTRYTVLSTLQGKMFQEMGEVIQAGGKG